MILQFVNKLLEVNKFNLVFLCNNHSDFFQKIVLVNSSVLFSVQLQEITEKIIKLSLVFCQKQALLPVSSSKGRTYMKIFRNFCVNIILQRSGAIAVRNERRKNHYEEKTAFRNFCDIRAAE